MASSTKRRPGFSLIELVIVIVIIAIIGAIAIPRLSRGAEGAAEAALIGNLSTLRSAIDLYRTEHIGLLPTDDSTIANQLTTFSDLLGNTNPTRTTTYYLGPYLNAMPELPVGNNIGSAAVRDGGNPGDGSEGWFYDKSTGEIIANTKNGEVDASGTPYNQY